MNPTTDHIAAAAGLTPDGRDIQLLEQQRRAAALAPITRDDDTEDAEVIDLTLLTTDV